MSWNTKTEFVAVDTETTGIDILDYPFAVSLCDDHGTTKWFEWDVNVNTRIPKIPKRDIREIEKSCLGKQLVFHNKAFDLQKLELINCKLDWKNKSWDTMFLSHIFNSSTHTELNGRLKELCLIYNDFDDEDQFELREAVIKARALVKKHNLGWSIAPNDKSDDHIMRDFWLPRMLVVNAWDIIPDNDEFDDPSFHPWYSICAKYGNGDTERTMLLFLSLMQYGFDPMKPDDKRLKILAREKKLSDTLYEMSKVGMRFFPQKGEEMIKESKKIIDKNTTVMSKLSGVEEFNPESPVMMSTALFDKLKFPKTLSKETATSTKERKLYQTNKNVREDLEKWLDIQDDSKLNTKRTKFFNALSGYKEATVTARYIPQYMDKLRDDFLYPNLKQNATATTRMASANPNGQNINELLRTSFGPSEDEIWYCLDYSQLQLRIFAYITQEQSMIDAFDRGYDFHGFVASKIFGMSIEDVNKDKTKRRIAKNVNFGFIFGASPSKIERTAGIVGLWDTVTKMFPSAHKFMESTKHHVKRYGYVTTPHGYRLYCRKPHAGVNYIVQGCEGDIVKEGMNLCSDYLADVPNFNMMFQVHDELDFVAKRPSKKSTIKMHRAIVGDLKQLMEEPGEDIGMKTPVDVEYTTTNWKDAQKGYYQCAT